MPLVAIGIGGGATVIVAVRRLRRALHPLLDLGVLHVRTFRVSALGGSSFRAVSTAMPFLLALYFQLGFGWTAARSGLVVSALFVRIATIKPATTLMRSLGIRAVMLGAIVGSAACLVGIALLRASTSLPPLVGLLVVGGVFRSIGVHRVQHQRFRRHRAGTDEPRPTP